MCALAQAAFLALDHLCLINQAALLAATANYLLMAKDLRLS
jgi:hypothetical protein